MNLFYDINKHLCKCLLNKHLRKLFMQTLCSLFCFSICILIPLVACSSRGQDLSNAMGSMYTAVLFIGVQNSASVQPVVSIERTVFYRERAAGMYSALPYALAQVIKSLFYTHTHTHKMHYGLFTYPTHINKIHSILLHRL